MAPLVKSGGDNLNLPPEKKDGLGCKKKQLP